MADCSITTFKARFTEFDAIADARITVFMDDALLILSEATWGDLYPQAVCYLTAHYLALAEESSLGSTGNVGNVSAKSVDGVSVTYSSVPYTNENQAYFGSTIYGQTLMSLSKSLGAMVFTT